MFVIILLCLRTTGVQLFNTPQMISQWGVCQVIILLWTIFGVMHGECHAPCMPKTTFVDYKKRVGNFFNPCQIIHSFPASVKRHCLIPTSFLKIILFYSSSICMKYLLQDVN
jgi:hypothetical protein